jgi:cytochrome c oxidase subunit II
MSPLFSMPTAASAFAHQVDVLLWSVAGVTGAVALAVFVLMIRFSFRYRRASDVDRTLDETASGRNPVLEITWITVPLVVFLIFFFWAARLYFAYESPPPRPLEVYVVAKQWMWKVEHSNGRREINTLHVPRGRPIKLVMTSQDVIHSFYVPAFRVKRDVVPGRFSILWFTATVSGDYHLFCAEYCGTDHSRMGGHVIVMEPEGYGRWLESGGSEPSLSQLGAERFIAFGCSGCHGANSTIHAPSLQGIYGRTVALSDGATVTVDERYLRDSILLPGREIVAGYANQMPSFAGRISEEDILDLIAYIKSLGDDSSNVEVSHHE